MNSPKLIEPASNSMPPSTITRSGAPEALPPPVFGAARGVVDDDGRALRVGRALGLALRVGLALVVGLLLGVAFARRAALLVVGLGEAEVVVGLASVVAGPVRCVGFVVRVGVARCGGVLRRVGLARCVGLVVIAVRRRVGLALVGVAEVGLTVVGGGTATDVVCRAEVLGDGVGVAFPSLSAVP